MTNTDKKRADFEEWRTELLDLIFHYANGAMLNGKTELKRHIARIERQIDAVPCAGREAERAEAVTDAEPVRAALEAAHKLLQPRLDEPDRTVFWLVVDALHDLRCCKTHPPKAEPSPGVEALKEAAQSLIEQGRITSGGIRRPAKYIQVPAGAFSALRQALTKPEGK